MHPLRTEMQRGVDESRTPTWGAHVWWLAGGVMALLLPAARGSVDADSTSLFLSVLSIGLGLWLFWMHGGRRITAAGVWGFSFALFVGFAGLYLVVAAPPPARIGLAPALAAAYLGQVFMCGFLWSRRPRRSTQPVDVDLSSARWGLAVSAVVLGASILLARIGLQANPLVDAAAFTATVLFACSLLGSPSRGTGVGRLLAVAIAFAAYFSSVFDGFGRLTVGTLGLALAIVACTFFPARAMKLLVLFASAPTLLILARNRALFAASIPGHPPESGIESIVGPLERFSELLVRFRELPRGWGSTFWAAAVALVPGGLWEGKPEGFGAVLVPIVRPELVGVGHSEAALSHGEWLFDFGLLGLLVMVPALGLGIRWLDRWLAKASIGPLSSRTRLLSFTAAVMAAAGVTDLLWVGTFTYVARTGSRLLVLVPLALIAGLQPVRRRAGYRAQAPSFARP